MRLYKANLDDNYEVLSYASPQETEEIYSVRKGETYDISYESIYEYVEMVGYIVFPLKESIKDVKHTMYIDIDYNCLTTWDNEIFNHVSDTIVQDIRKNIIESFFSEDNDSYFNEDEDGLVGITGHKEIFQGEMTYLSHKYKGGIWESSDENIIEIDRDTGMMRGNRLGEVQISYEVDSGCGMLTCFKKVKVVI